MTTIGPLAAGINAYRDVAGPRQPTANDAAGAAAGRDDGFGAALKNVAESWLQTLRQGEQKSAQAVAGEVDIRDVIVAVNNAELTLQTAVAVRDKVILAYQEIMRMPI
jgi:flagellar hook-basal body complex protein FliE